MQGEVQVVLAYEGVGALEAKWYVTVASVSTL